MLHRRVWILILVLLGLAAVPWGVETARAQQDKEGKAAYANARPRLRSTTNAQRKAAAARLAAARVQAGIKPPQLVTMNPGGVPDYFGGTVPNWAFSPLQTNNTATAPLNVIITGIGGSGAAATALVTNGYVSDITLLSGGSGYTAATTTVAIDPGLSGGTGAAATATINPATTSVTAITITNPGSGYWLIRNANGTLTGAIRKFVDSLPGLTAANANNLGNYLPVAVADTAAFSGSDYYKINLVQLYPEAAFRPTRHINERLCRRQRRRPGPLPGSGHRRLERQAGSHSVQQHAARQRQVLPARRHHRHGRRHGPGTASNYSANRATLHLHGGDTPWISDGTPHQWTSPGGRNHVLSQGRAARKMSPTCRRPGAGPA